VVVSLSALVVVALVWLCLPLRLLSPSYSTVLVGRDGRLLGAAIASDQQWRFPASDSVPARFGACIVAWEDRRFHAHPGVDPLALARAVVQNVRGRKVVSGASTITMQVIRLSRRGRPRTVPEKLVEMALALRLDLRRSKRAILAAYAAYAPFGGNVVGLEAAAWRYFGRPSSALSWAECATLAVLPNSPALIHPGRNRALLLAKRNRLLERLRDRGAIESLTCALSQAEPLPDRPHPIPSHAPHLLERARSAGHGGAVVVTTLDRGLQTRAIEILAARGEELAANGVHNAAALILECATGQVLAYVGNSVPADSAAHGWHVDCAMAPRSTGSILKPLLYAAMLEDGELLPTELVPDIPVRIGGFAPENYSRSFQGAVPASAALARSLNVPAVHMLRSYGVERFAGMLRRLGMTTLNRPSADYGLSLILGGAEGSLWEITGIYAGLARCVSAAFPEGNDQPAPTFAHPAYLAADHHSPVRNPQSSIPNPHSAIPDLQSAISDPQSAIRNPHCPIANPQSAIRDPQSALSSASCYLTVQAMLEVTRPGEESAWESFMSSRRVAWKTGTSYGHRDAWAVGITPQFAVGVWAGNADGEGRASLTGITSAAPILFDLFGLLPSGAWFDPPESELHGIDVCAASGYRKGPDCAAGKRIRVPQAGLRCQACPFCRTVHCDPTHRWRVHASCESLPRITPVSWFTLPPAMEWYYRRHHADYLPLPPYRPDCLAALGGDTRPPMAIVIPREGSAVYVPRELDGVTGRTVFEAAHRDQSATVYWHLDGQYIGATREIHQMPLAPAPGTHTLVLVDQDGARLERVFEVLGREGK